MTAVSSSSRSLPGGEPLCCPACTADLQPAGSGVLRCAGCRTEWPSVDGIPRLYLESRVQGTDRLLRRIYDGLPSLYDPTFRAFIRLLQPDESAARMRERYLDRMELDRLPEGPVRVLEIGVGTGQNIEPIRDRLGTHRELEYWGIDLSLGMLKRCQRRLAEQTCSAELLLADAHYLPFRDRSFDRVLQIGAVNGFSDPRRALAEMARVARPGAPIVVVDEQLDPQRSHSRFQTLAFRLITFYDRDPHCPRELLPPGATGVLEEPLSRFFFCLSFRVTA
jgi:SAM-dependent methyltransferase